MVLLDADKISFGYSPEKILIDRLCFNLSRGESLGVTGENGSGKTTLAKLLVGILKPVAGAIFLEKTDLKRLSLGRIGEKIGYVMQNPEIQLLMPSVEEEITFGLRMRGCNERKIKKKSEDLLQFFEIESLLKAPVFTLSTGEKQRLAMAAVLALEPRLLILDEPTAGLDPLRKAKLGYLLDKLLQNGLGLILISHDTAFIRQHCEKNLSL